MIFGILHMKDSNKCFSTIKAKTNIEALLKVIWTLSEDGELENVQDFLEKKNTSLKKIINQNELEESILSYIRYTIEKLNFTSDTPVFQIINVNTNEILFSIDPEVIDEQEFEITDEDDFFETILELSD